MVIVYDRATLRHADDLAKACRISALTTRPSTRTRVEHRRPRVASVNLLECIIRPEWVTPPDVKWIRLCYTYFASKVVVLLEVLFPHKTRGLG